MRNNIAIALVQAIEQGSAEDALKLLDASSNAVERVSVLSAAISMLSLQQYDMKTQLEKLKNKLAAYEILEDSYATSFIDAVCNTINDLPSALRASSMYDKDWFADLEFSQSAKISFCQRLIETISVYNPSYVSTLWTNVVNGTSDALEAINFSRMNAEKED
jgi:hypothetical protein